MDTMNDAAENSAAEHYIRAREYLASRASNSLILAISEFTKVVEADPDYKDAYERLKYALEEEQGMREDISDFEATLATDPNDVATRYRMAAFLRILGRDDDAIHHWRVVAKLEFPDWSKSARKMLRKHYQIIES